MKITLDELNHAYSKVNELKNSFTDLGQFPLEIEVSIDRNPLIDDYFDNNSDFVTPFKLKFKIQPFNTNTKIYYILDTQVEVIDED